jgi:two-component system, sensor histidine kinase and response regulator
MPCPPVAEVREFTAAVREITHGSGVSVHVPVLTAVTGSGSDDPQAASGSGIDGVVTESMDADALTLAIARLASAIGSDRPATKVPHLAPELPILDVEELQAQVAYDSELLVELIDLYLSERSRQSEEMAQALNANDFGALSRVAHTIKGSLGSLHAHAARSTAQNVELAARDLDGPRCQDFLPHLERQLDELERHLLAVKQSLGNH